MQEEKKEKAKNANPSLNVFMAQMQEQNKKQLKDEKANGVNPMITNN